MRDSTPAWEDSHSEYPVLWKSFAGGKKWHIQRKVLMALNANEQNLEEQVNTLFQQILVFTKKLQLKESEDLVKMKEKKPRVPEEIAACLCKSIIARLKAWQESVVFFSASILSAIKLGSEELREDYLACMKTLLSTAESLGLANDIVPMLNS